MITTPKELHNTKVRVSENRQDRAKVVIRLLNLGFESVYGNLMGKSYGLYLKENGSIIAETSDVTGTDFKQRTEYREVSIEGIFKL